MIALVGVLMVVVVADWRSAAAIAIDRRERGFVRVVLDDRIDAGQDGRYGAVRISGDPERWVWDLHGAVAIGGLRVHAASRAFERPITVEYSSDATSWWSAGDATVARYADGTERLGIAFSPRSARYWRLTVDNGDDAPVTGLQPALLARSPTLPDGVLGVPGPHPSQFDGIGSEMLIDACRVVAIVLGAVAVRALRSPR